MNYRIKEGMEEQVSGIVEKYESDCIDLSDKPDFDLMKLVFVRKFNELVELYHAPTLAPYWGVEIGHHEQQSCLPHDCYVGYNTVIEDRVNIGKNVIIEGNNYIFSGTKIGNNVVIKPGAIIGGQGFGFVWDAENRNYIIFPHIGGIDMGNDVCIGSNTCIDRGQFHDTVIKTGAKIDNLVHVAHDCIIGKNALVIANCVIAGYATVGENSRISPLSGIVPRKHVGDNTQIGMGSTVLSDIGDNVVAFGSPAREIRKRV